MNIYEQRIEILNKIIEKSGLNLSEFCQKHDLSQSYLSQIINGHRTLGDKAALNLEEKLQLKAGELTSPQRIDIPNFENGPELTRWKKTDIVGTAQLGTEGYWSALDEAEGYVEIISCDPGAYALRVKGDSMSPTIRNNWIIWCEPNHELINGEYVMVKTADGQSMIKELLYQNNMEVSLMSVNQDYGRITIPLEDIEKIHYVGGIVPPSKIRY